MTRRPARRAQRSASSLPNRRWRWLAAGSALLLLVGLLALDYQLRAKFDGKKWALPARVYAAPLELYEGARIEPADLEQTLKRLGYVPVARLSGPGQFSRAWAPGGARLAIHSRGFAFGDGQERPQVWQLRLAGGELQSLATDSGENLLRLEPEQIGGIYPAHREDRLPVRLAEVPPLLGEALIAVEDKRFLAHWGLSPRGIARALLANLRQGGVAQGGSTITQQLVKNFYLSNERSLSRKALEAVMALLLELHYDKAEILETYINEVYLGQQGAKAVHGFALAARHYFRRPLAELRLDQLALLVGLVKGASYYNPWQHPARAKARRDLVLDILAQDRLISRAQQIAAKGRPLQLAPQDQAPLDRFANYLDLVKRQLARDYAPQDLRSEGLRIFTSLDLRAQQLAEQRLAGELARLERDHGLANHSLQGAVVVASVGGAELLALVGDREPDRAGFNRALDARRPVGSLAKPAVFLTALARPDAFQLDTPLSDAPVTVRGPDGDWAPRNYDRQSHGRVPLYQALAQSYNQATARLGMQLGLASVADTLARLGGDAAPEPVPSLLLGSQALSPLAVAEQYHTIAADGFHSPLRAIRSVTDRQGRPLSRYPLAVSQRFAAEAIYQLQYGLQSVLREGTGQAAYQYLPATMALAGKTGTTNDQRDSWFAGFNGSHLAVVWVGRDDNGTTPLTGATGALPVWARLLADLGGQSLDSPPPDGVAFHWVDPASGQASAENCRGARLLPYSAGHAPSGRAHCDYVQHPLSHWWSKLGWNKLWR